MVRPGALSLCVALAACGGPTLYVGDLKDEELDGGAVDSAMPEDASDARVRDAARDGRVVLIIPCQRNLDCSFIPELHCANFGICVECEMDRDCKNSEKCDEFQCRPDDRPHGP